MNENAPRGCAARGEVVYAPHTARARKESTSDSLICYTESAKAKYVLEDNL